MHRGMLGHIDVEGEADTDIYQPNPGGDGESSDAASEALWAWLC